MDDSFLPLMRIIMDDSFLHNSRQARNYPNCIKKADDDENHNEGLFCGL